MAAALHVENLSASRDGRAVLRDVTLHLDAGGCVSLVGPNGGGKTTLLRAVLGLPGVRVTGGTISLAGLSPAKARQAGNVIGFIPQRPMVPAALPVTGRQAVSLAASRVDAAFADDLLERLAGGATLHDKTVTTMSGGQLQQVFVARALANRPKLLLLDEPTVGLDKAAVDRLVSVLELARREFNCGVMVATHDHLVALRMTSDLAYLDGTIKYRGPATAVPKHLDARLCHHE